MPNSATRSRETARQAAVQALPQPSSQGPSTEVRDPWLRLAILWLVIIPVLAFWLSSSHEVSPLELKVLPEAPREDEPVVVSIQLSNLYGEDLRARYGLYSNGKTLFEGSTLLAPGESQQYRYIAEGAPGLGRQTTFVARASFGADEIEKRISLPPYPPQVWSSFVSFASFSTSMMSSMSTAIYYKDYFGAGIGANLGFVLVLSLLVFSFFQEFTFPFIREGRKHLLARMHLRLHEMVVLLAIVFMGIVYTILVLKM